MINFISSGKTDIKLFRCNLKSILFTSVIPKKLINFLFIQLPVSHKCRGPKPAHLGRSRESSLDLSYCTNVPILCPILPNSRVYASRRTCFSEFTLCKFTREFRIVKTLQAHKSPRQYNFVINQERPQRIRQIITLCNVVIGIVLFPLQTFTWVVYLNITEASVNNDLMEKSR